MQQDNIITNIIDHLRTVKIEAPETATAHKECRALLVKAIEIYAEYKSMEFGVADEALEREFLDSIEDFCSRYNIRLQPEKILSAFLRGLNRRIGRDTAKKYHWAKKEH